MNITGDNYGTARQFVLTITGFYCSYCEAPLGVDMPVEHKIPKGGRYSDHKCFPEEASKYYNFVIACSTCNSTKSARLNQDDAFKFLQQLFPTVGSFDYLELVYGALFSVVWPDVVTKFGDAPSIPEKLKPYYTGKDETFKLFSYSKQELSQVDLLNQGFVRLEKGDEKKQWAKTKYDMVWALPNQTYINQQPNSALLLDRVKRTLVTVNLNYHNPTDLKASDRRVHNRTMAHAAAVGALAELAKIVEIAVAQDPDVLKSGQVFTISKLIRSLAIATGYWSTWMAVFADITEGKKQPWATLSQASREGLLEYLLVQYSADENRKRVYDFQPDPPTIFTGTDLTRVIL